MSDDIKGRIVKVLKDALPGVDVAASNTLVDDGVLDSLAISIIIAELSMEFGIQIPFDELESANFNSLDTMSALVMRCEERKQ
ncbi:MAG: acyl carrier protein [Synergistaceae bacterium]|nr:acyl carrier protein [Synergistaceae bacterium]